MPVQHLQRGNKLTAEQRPSTPDTYNYVTPNQKGPIHIQIQSVLRLSSQQSQAAAVQLQSDQQSFPAKKRRFPTKT